MNNREERAWADVQAECSKAADKRAAIRAELIRRRVAAAKFDHLLDRVAKEPVVPAERE